MTKAKSGRYDLHIPAEDQRFDVVQGSGDADIKELASQKHAADNYRLLLDEADHEYAAMKAERDAALTEIARLQWNEKAAAVLQAKSNADDAEIARLEAERDAALELLSEALYALEYGVDMTKPEGMSWCDCPSCTVIPKIRKLMKNIHVVRDVAR
jgi:hypothetical protein